MQHVFPLLYTYNTNDDTKMAPSGLSHDLWRNVHVFYTRDGSATTAGVATGDSVTWSSSNRLMMSETRLMCSSENLFFWIQSSSISWLDELQNL